MSKKRDKRGRHGHSHQGAMTPTYQSWRGMVERCTNERHVVYSLYGGRGIKVCARWLGEHGFENFLADMGERPEGKTIDRFPDKNGNYEPSNCRWATPKEQTQNSALAKVSPDLVRDIRRRAESGESKSAIARDLGISNSQVGKIARRLCWANIV